MKDRTIRVDMSNSREWNSGGKLFQFDHGLKLAVSGLDDLTNIPQFQFTNENMEKAITVIPDYSDGVYTADIPDIILMHPVDFVCYIYVEGTDDGGFGVTQYQINFKIQARNQPEGTIYTEDQISNYDLLVSMLQAKTIAAEGYVKDAEAWAAGTRDGNPVTSSDEAYHNNAKYYADLSSQKAGYMDFKIDEYGHLIYQKTSNMEHIDFVLQDGRLVALWPEIATP